MITNDGALAILDDPEALRDHWLGAMALEEMTPDEFEPVPHTASFHRVYGGRSMAQVVVAAGRTAPAEMVPHNLQVTFMRPGKANAPTRYLVERARDGRSFTNRRVTAVQDGVTLFEALVSLGRAFDGLAYAPPLPDTPAPQALPQPQPDQMGPARGLSLPEIIGRFGLGFFYLDRRARPLEAGTTIPPPPFLSWVRPCAPLPEDPLIHAAALAWVSDGPIIGVVAGQLDLPDTPGKGATLNHSIWWHAPPRWDSWLLYACEAHAAFADRGLQMGRMYAEDGTLLATVAQETLFPTRA